MQDLIRPDASFTPRELFARMQGAWFEPRIGSMWQENTGATATTAVGQTVGLLLDLSQGAVLGPELVVNGTFDADLSGWTLANTNAANTITWENGGARIVSDGSLGVRMTQNILTIGLVYSVTITIISVTGSGIKLTIPAAETIIPAVAGTYQYTITANTGTFAVSRAYAGQSSNTLVDNISVRQILGYHASQATAANRPKYQLGNGLPLVRCNSNHFLTVYLTDLGGGVFSSSGSVYFALPTGMSALHNQSIGTTYNLPALQTDIYGTVITPARLAPPLEQRLALYMHRLAGLSDADFFWQEQATDGMTGQLLADDNDTILLRG